MAGQNGSDAGADETRILGTVKFFRHTWGMIRTQNGYDVFVYWQDIVPKEKNGNQRRPYLTLRRGQDVSFIIKSTPKGPIAREVLGLKTLYTYWRESQWQNQVASAA